jgi:hypothetical protein
VAKAKRLNGPLKAQLVLGWREKIWLARCDLPFAPFPGLIIRVDEYESLKVHEVVVGDYRVDVTCICVLDSAGDERTDGRLRAFGFADDGPGYP